MIYLVGFMGSGKSTVAEQLSRKLGMPYIEMDEEIEKQEGLSISEMFATQGESFFREKETSFLRGISKDVIVSTGGGIILSKDNRHLLKSGTVIYLKAEWETIVKRLREDTNRPLWKGDEQEKKNRFESRLALYDEVADEIVSVDERTPCEIAVDIQKRIK
ncbi:shikimate kinase [Halobacillus dabanensis]|uniref:Shikimate kinase n=1 Tax=Halobacillus dabanensis TaxID=240302 RepID=A0A1I3PJW3_HALDA|nr:shikimate kinase [Halobacillus dabanensis]SFJ21326.1 shikimate kinase [Halobacillus dabanensis]